MEPWINSPWHRKMTTSEFGASEQALAAESYLRRFHDSASGNQFAHMAHLNSNGSSSYLCVADRVAGAQRILDLGCADGALLELLGTRGASMLAGIDLAEGELAFARRRPALAQADLRLGRAQELPWPDGSFDAVVSHMALMLMGDVEQVATEVARVLTCGGVLVVGIGGSPVEGGAWELFRGIVRAHNAVLPEPRKIPPLGDPRVRTREGLDEILTPHGFAPVTWEPVLMDTSLTPTDAWERLRGS